MLVGGLPGGVAIWEGHQAHVGSLMRQAPKLFSRRRHFPAILLKGGLVVEEHHALVGDRDRIQFTGDNAGAISPGQQLVCPTIGVGITRQWQQETARHILRRGRVARQPHDIGTDASLQGGPQLVIDRFLRLIFDLNIVVRGIESINDEFLHDIVGAARFHPPGNGYDIVLRANRADDDE